MLKNMKVKKSLILGYGITIVISVALIIASLMMMNNQRGQYEMLMNEDVETNMAILNARVNAITAGRNYRDALLVPESSANESLIAQAEADGRIKPGATLIEPTSGEADLYQKPV